MPPHHTWHRHHRTMCGLDFDTPQGVVGWEGNGVTATTFPELSIYTPSFQEHLKLLCLSSWLSSSPLSSLLKLQTLPFPAVSTLTYAFPVSAPLWVLTFYIQCRGHTFHTSFLAMLFRHMQSNTVLLCTTLDVSLVQLKSALIHRSYRGTDSSENRLNTSPLKLWWGQTTSWIKRRKITFF